jgi:hypothetical protein
MHRIRTGPVKAVAIPEFFITFPKLRVLRLFQDQHPCKDQNVDTRKGPPETGGRGSHCACLHGHALFRGIDTAAVRPGGLKRRDGTGLGE